MEKEFTILYRYDLMGVTFVIGMKAKNEKHAFMKFQNLCREASTQAIVINIIKKS